MADQLMGNFAVGNVSGGGVCFGENVLFTDVDLLGSGKTKSDFMAVLALNDCCLHGLVEQSYLRFKQIR